MFHRILFEIKNKGFYVCKMHFKFSKFKVPSYVTKLFLKMLQKGTMLTIMVLPNPFAAPIDVYVILLLYGRRHNKMTGLIIKLILDIFWQFASKQNYHDYQSISRMQNHVIFCLNFHINNVDQLVYNNITSPSVPEKLQSLSFELYILWQL